MMASLDLTQVSSSMCFGGFVYKYKHYSTTTDCTMTFNIYLPPSVKVDSETKVPALYFLSGLTCNEDNMITKAGALQYLSDKGIALITPDTSPRGCGIPGEDDSWDLGTGAGFYVDATTDKWSKHYNMYSYISAELPSIISANFPIGGHGAIMIALRNPKMYKSVSAFAPICHPSETPALKNTITEYLGPNKDDWVKYDSTELASNYQGPNINILMDQGSDDSLLKSNTLHPDHFVAAVENSKEYINLQTRVHPGYDHGYYFIQSFIKDHIDFHSTFLLQ
ncbi:S-formylglutathione hydrolase [Smittium mucronatum]|uniref:S-formylglutathione hydrolase n=1 Tax=Smittium mucronatum TaxID=133383 RepID=A0A1R0GUG3_9FUNG|nr:S-formylglutathione hydrolase [Smittium mucronatum]